MRRIIPFLLLLLALRAHAQSDTLTSRPVTSVYSLEIGGSRVRSQYLSPMFYQGTDIAVTGNWQKAMPFAPSKALMDFDVRISGFPRLINPGGNALMQGFEMEFFWGIGAYFRLPHNFTVSIEGGPQAIGGAFAMLRNSNNPVGVNISATLAAKGQLSWKGNIKRLPVSASLSARIPMAGAFFMPGYGETFYEIYVGNHSGLAHFGWPGNHFRLNMMCAFRMDLGRTGLEIGYRLTAERTHANNLTNRILTNNFSIGVIPDGLGGKSKKSQIRPH